MTSLMNNEEIISQINEYPNHNYIWIEIWQINKYEIQLVITINEESVITFNHKVLRVNSLFIDEESPELIKTRGRELKKLIKNVYKNSEIHSNLHYK